MSYNRPPNVVVAGIGLTQNPPATTTSPPGILPVTIDADVATTSSLGIIQVGSGLSITSSGILSATNSESSLINVSLVSVDYTATLDNYYIGATKGGITITLPLGVAGKVFVIKNQAKSNIIVEGTNDELIDSAEFKTLGSDSSLIVIFDGFRWNVV